MSANDPKRTLRSEQRASLPINQSHNEFYFRDSAKPQFPRTDFVAAGGDEVQAHIDFGEPPIPTEN